MDGDVSLTMSDSQSSTPLAPLFRAQRALIDSTIETQRTINSHGLELTRQSTKALVGVFLPESEATEDVLDEAQRTAADGVDATERTVDAVEEATDTATDTAEAADDVPVVTLDGIGATYSSRLAAAGLGTVRDLAAASVEEVAEVAQVGTDRAAEWIDRAQTGE